MLNGTETIMKKERIGVAALACAALMSVPQLHGAAFEVLLEEDFETDGSGSRYQIFDGGVLERDDLIALDNFEQILPIYWAHDFDISHVGIDIAAPARRALLTWHHTIDAAAVTDDAKQLIDGVIDWLSEGRASTVVHFATGGPGNAGDDVIIERLQAKGFTLTDTPGGGAALPDPDTVAFIVHSSAADDNTQGAYGAPILHYNSSSADDLLVSSIGAADDSITVDNITIKVPGLASGGLDGTHTFVNGVATFDRLGVRLPEGAVTVASALFAGSVPVENLQTVDDMIAGTVASIQTTGPAPEADLALGAGGVAGVNIAVPGDPVGGFGVVGDGVLDVAIPGTYTFALGVDDGARLRIDIDGNGIDAGDDVIVYDRQGGFDFAYGDVTFPSAGMYDFEWVSFNTAGDFGAEIWYFLTEGGGGETQGPPSEATGWTYIADWRLFGFDDDPLFLEGNIDLTVYEIDAPPVLVEAPLLVTIDTGVPLLGGTITAPHGDHFFAGAALNKFGAGGEKRVTFNPVNVAGKTNLKLEFLIAGTDLDFETSDYFDIYIDKNNTGSFERLVHFTAPSGSDKYISDGTTRVGNRFKKGCLRSAFGRDKPCDRGQGSDVVVQRDRGVRLSPCDSGRGGLCRSDNINQSGRRLDCDRVHRHASEHGHWWTETGAMLLRSRRARSLFQSERPLERCISAPAVDTCLGWASGEGTRSVDWGLFW